VIVFLLFSAKNEIRPPIPCIQIQDTVRPFNSLFFRNSIKFDLLDLALNAGPKTKGFGIQSSWFKKDFVFFERGRKKDQMKFFFPQSSFVGSNKNSGFRLSAPQFFEKE